MSVIGTGIAGATREAELTAVPAESRTVTEEEQLRAATRAIAFVHTVAAEFARNGVRELGGDLAALPWWPDASRTADVRLRLMSYSAAGELEVERIDPDAIDLSAVNLGTLNLRAFRPQDFFT